MTSSKTKQISDIWAHTPKKKHKAVKSQSFLLAMRDGTEVAVDLMLPADLDSGERVPAVLTMTRYWRSFELRMPEPRNRAPIGPRESLADDLVLRGFAMVIVDGRGSGASTGTSRHPWTPEEIADYGEVATWAAQQPWSNGNVGGVGISYEGTTAQLLATTGVEAVKGVVPQQFEFDVYADLTFPGGVFNEAFVQAWGEGAKLLDRNKLPQWFPIPWFVRWLLKGVRPVDTDRKTRTMLAKALSEHETNTDVYPAMSQITFRDDDFGETGATLDDFSVFARKAEIEASGSPIFVWGSWLDAATADTVLRMFNSVSNPQIAVIGAWSHEKNKHGSPYTKAGAKPDPGQPEQWAAIAQFFEQTLKNGTPPRDKTLFYYTLGAETWKQSDAFPLLNTEMETWYFRDGNQLSPEAPPEETGSDSYTVDFTATTGTNNRWHTELAKPLIYPDRAKEDGRLLTYTSGPLEREVQITGYPVVTLQVSSTADDGAFFVYLEDVDESGAVRYVTEGILRGVHRKLSDETPPYFRSAPYRTFKRADAAPLPRGETVELIFGLLPTSVLLRRGHRIRVAIAGADKDTFARIPETGVPTLKVSRGRALASSIQLPVVK